LPKYSSSEFSLIQIELLCMEKRLNGVQIPKFYIYGKFNKRHVYDRLSLNKYKIFISRTSQLCLKKVNNDCIQYMYSIGLLCIQYMYSIGLLCIQYMYNIGLLCIQYMYSIGLLCIQYMYSIGLLCIQYMYSIGLL
jgi:ribosomal protein L33